MKKLFLFDTFSCFSDYFSMLVPDLDGCFPSAI